MSIAWKLLEMHIRGPRFRPREPEILGMAIFLANLPADSKTHACLRAAGVVQGMTGDAGRSTGQRWRCKE